MTHRANYSPGPATGARVGKKEGDSWTLVLVRTMRHTPDTVWAALTEPDQLRQWAPFDTTNNLGTTGNTAMLTTVGAPSPHVTETRVTRADAPHVLEYQWGGKDMRWELEAVETGTRLTLWASIDRRYIALGAAGWHICLDVLDAFVGGEPIGRTVGPEVMKFEGWQRLLKEYSQQFGAESPVWNEGAK